jgi:NADH-quinone oxidoreductase subunit J
MIGTILFYAAAAGLLLAGLAVVTSRSPLRSALALIVALCALALLYILLEASFVAAMQVLVYAGAIMVLFVFVIMLLNLQPGGGLKPAYLSISKMLGTLAAAYLFYAVLEGAGFLKNAQAKLPAIDGTVKNIGRLLLTDYLFGFEAISVLLLVAVVGAVVLGQKRLT